MIEQYNLTLRWDTKNTITSGQIELESNSNEEVFHILQTPSLKPHHQIQFCVLL